MRSNRLWIGVTCGVALALSVVAAVDAGTQTAGAQANGEPATSCGSNRVAAGRELRTHEHRPEDREPPRVPTSINCTPDRRSASTCRNDA